MDVLKLLLFGLILNPYFLGVWGVGIIIHLLFNFNLKKRTRYIAISGILILFGISIFIKIKGDNQFNKRIAEKEEKKEKLRLLDESRVVSKRSYFVDYSSFISELRNSYTDYDLAEDSLDWEFENSLNPISFEDFKKYHISSSIKANRLLVGRYYLPFLDSVSQYLERDNSLYIHYADTSFMTNDRYLKLVLDYESDKVKGEAVGVLDLDNAELKILKIK